MCLRNTVFKHNIFLIHQLPKLFPLDNVIDKNRVSTLIYDLFAFCQYVATKSVYANYCKDIVVAYDVLRIANSFPTTDEWHVITHILDIV